METTTAQSKGIFIPNDAKKHLNEGKTTILREQKSIKRVLQEVLKEVLHEVFNGRKWPTTYLQKVLREVLQEDRQEVFHGNS